MGDLPVLSVDTGCPGHRHRLLSTAGQALTPALPRKRAHMSPLVYSYPRETIIEPLLPVVELRVR